MKNIDFEKEWETALPKIKNFANRRIRGLEDREDLIQDAKIKAFTQIHRFRNDGNFANWAISILKNAHLDYLRAKSRRIQAFTIDEEILEIPASTPVNNSSDIFQKLIYELPSECHRKCLEARFVHGMRYKDIAKSLDIPSCTVRSRVHRGVKALRNLCDNLGVGV